MALISEIKCARCDRKHSGVRSRCPYCGERRIGTGKNPEASNNSTVKMLVSVMIMAVFTISAAFLLFTTSGNTDAGADYRPPENDPAANTIEDGNETVSGFFPDPTPEPEDEPEEPQITVTSVRVRSPYGFTSDFTQPKGEPIRLTAVVYSGDDEIDEDVTWESSDLSIFEFAHVDDEIELLGISEGHATLTARAGDKEAKVTVRIG